MSTRKIQQVIPAMEVSEGAGVTVYRTIGTPQLKHLDPFLMLDHFASSSADDYIAGFPPHPHRGFITLTYMLDGNMRHEDSMGNKGHLKSGGIQWMKAASGVIHSEMPEQEQGLMRGFQLWINLPAAQKMSDPEYQEFNKDFIPVIESDTSVIKVIVGNYQNTFGPVKDPNTHVMYLDIQLQADTEFQTSVSDTDNVFVAVFEGDIIINNIHISNKSLAVLTPGDNIVISAGKQGARFILLTGEPINEPVVQHGPFVMNDMNEIRQAVHDYQNNRLVAKKAAFISE